MAEIVGVIGGTGLGELVAGEAARDIPTPFGPASVTLGELGGRPIAFVPRHGAGHTIAPHRINARANLWALAHHGVRALVSTAAVGSLSTGYPPESFALADQLVDRTFGRADTYFDSGPVRHLPFAEPFCPVLRSIAIEALPDAAPRATVAVIQGPRFSTAAESRILREAGVDLVNMTLCPEVALAAEIGIGAAAICVVTDTDSGTSADDPDAVTAELVFRRLAEAKPRLVAALGRIVAEVPRDYLPRPLMDDETVSTLRRLPVTS